MLQLTCLPKTAIKLMQHRLDYIALSIHYLCMVMHVSSLQLWQGVHGHTHSEPQLARLPKITNLNTVVDQVGKNFH